MIKRLVILVLVMLMSVSNLAFATTFEDVKEQAVQAGLEITWIDTDATNFSISSDYEVSDNRYVVNCFNDVLMYHHIVINKDTGKIIPTAHYNWIGQFMEGRAFVRYCDKELIYGGSGYKYGFIDIEGNEVIPTIYDNVSDFSEGLSAVEKGGKTGYIDYDGDVIMPLEYIWAQPFDGGFATVGKLDINGDKIAGIIDKKGNFTLVKGSITISKFENGIARAKNEQEEYFINTKGNKVIETPQEINSEILKKYPYVSEYKEGRAIVIDPLGDNWLRKVGVIDEKGNEIIPMKYSRIYDYNDGMTSAQFAGGNFAYFDINGNKVTPFKYTSTSNFHEGTSIVGTGYYEDGSFKKGVINKYGDEIVPLIFNSISNFNDGYALVGVGNGNKYVIEKLGIMKLPKTVNINIGNNKPITVTLDGKNIIFDQEPILDSNRILVPIRAILEEIGAEVIWEDNGKVTVTKGDTKIELTIGGKEAFINGKSNILDVPAKLISSRTLVPVRFITECFGYDVNWNQEAQTVIITQK